jgi:predicted nucleic acid-binding protein
MAGSFLDTNILVYAAASDAAKADRAEQLIATLRALLTVEALTVSIHTQGLSLAER